MDTKDVYAWIGLLRSAREVYIRGTDSLTRELLTATRQCAMKQVSDGINAHNYKNNISIVSNLDTTTFAFGALDILRVRLDDDGMHTIESTMVNDETITKLMNFYKNLKEK